MISPSVYLRALVYFMITGTGFTNRFSGEGTVTVNRLYPVYTVYIVYTMYTVNTV